MTPSGSSCLVGSDVGEGDRSLGAEARSSRQHWDGTGERKVLIRCHIWDLSGSWTH